MQILGVAGRSGAGKTTLIRHIAESVLDSSYGTPKILDYDELGTRNMPDAFIKLRDEEFARLEEGGTETFVLVDNVTMPIMVEQIHEWGGNVIFVCADGRLKDLHEEWRNHPREEMADRYTAGKSFDMFDFCITNHKDEEGFKKEAARFMHLFLGGDASYEAGLF